MEAPTVEDPSSKAAQKELKRILTLVARKNSGEKEFIQAVKEVAEDVVPFIEENKKYKEANIFERMCEPERIFIFRVPWMDDKGNYRTNRGYRVQMNSAIGPYKGGLRLHPTVNLSILKFLAFEQIFKNSLTTLPLGAGKGGADLNPKELSDKEIMKFCQSYMTELAKYIGQNIDIPAGDIGTGRREIGYMFGQYKRLRNEFVGVLTGKDASYGGSLIRPEATGYGSVYFADEMMKFHHKEIKGKKCVISGAGNVAQYTTEKLIECGAKVLTLSDTGGFIYDKEGIDEEKLRHIMHIKNGGGRLSDYCQKYKAEYFSGQRPWNVPCDMAFPSATQNELDKESAETLVKNGCFLICEGANMPSTPDAIKVFNNAGVLYGPAKAANAGGVAVSGLEMAQNSIRYSWTKEEVDSKLKEIMVKIHEKCISYGKEKQNGKINYSKGANIAGFIKVADAMLAQGLV